MHVPLKAYEIIPGSPDTLSLLSVSGSVLESLEDEVQSFEVSRLEGLQNNDLPLPPEFVYLSTSAKTFVEQLTGTSIDVKTSWHARTPDDTQGTTITNNGNVIVGRDNIETEKGTDFYWRIVGSTLAHEYTHATGQQTLKRVAIVGAMGIGYEPLPGYGIINLAHFRSSSKQPVKQGSFIEEAFAAEVEAMWREKVNLGYAENGNDLISTEMGKLPLRFMELKHGIYHPKPQGFYLAIPSYAGYGLQLMKQLIIDRGGPDVFELLIKSRQPNQEARAKQKIAHSINSLSPGLHRHLMSLEYTKKDFSTGLSLIKSLARVA